MIKLSTLCYIERDGKYLMMHRVVKENDVNRDKWIGIGGRFEERESPDDCLLREVREETRLELTEYRFRGIVTFIYKDITEHMHLYTATGFTGGINGEPDLELGDEGILEWVDKDKIGDLDLWEGDRIFFRLIERDEHFFTLKLVYDDDDILLQAVLNGTSIM